MDFEIKRANVANIKHGHIIHPVLPEAFIERVKAFKTVLAEVETTSLEDTLKGFQIDSDPKTELFVWEHIAKIYQWSIVANTGLILEQKKDVLKLLLELSAGMRDMSNTKLSKEMVDEIADRYQYP